MANLDHGLALLLAQKVLERLETHPALLPVAAAQALKIIVVFLKILGSIEMIVLYLVK